MHLLEKFDCLLLDFFYDFTLKSNCIFTRPFEFLTLITEKGFIYYFPAILLFLKGRKKESFVLVCSLILSSIVTGVILKNLVCRSRPFMNLDNGYYLMWLKLKTFKESGFSFPSGHATLSAAFSFSLIFSLKKPSKYLLLFVPLVIGIARISLLAHYPTDVLAGYTVGILCAFASSTIIAKTSFKS